MGALYTTICKAQSDTLPWEDREEAIRFNYTQKFGKNINLNRIPVADYFAPDQIESRLSPNYMIIDGKYVTYAYLPSSAYPVQAYGGWLQVLFGYMEDVNVDLWVHKESPESIQRRLQFELKNKRIQQKNTDDIASDYDDIVSSLEAGFYIKQQLANGDDFCYISTILTLYANSEEELNDRFREMRDYCIRNDMNLKRCTFQQDEAFLATIPTSLYNKGIYSKSKRNVMASQLGSCYPFKVLPFHHFAFFIAFPHGFPEVGIDLNHCVTAAGILLQRLNRIRAEKPGIGVVETNLAVFTPYQQVFQRCGNRVTVISHLAQNEARAADNDCHGDLCACSGIGHGKHDKEGSEDAKNVILQIPISAFFRSTMLSSARMQNALSFVGICELLVL